MWLSLQRFLSLLDASGRRQLLLLAGLSLLSALLELVGVTSIMPFMAIAAEPQLLESQPQLVQARLWLGQPSPRSLLIFWACIVLAALAAVHCAQAAVVWLGARFSHSQQERLALRLYQAYLHRPYLWHLDHHSAELMESLGRARALCERIYAPLLILLVRATASGVIVAMLAWVDGRATLLIGLVLGGLFAWIYRRSRRRLDEIARRELFLSVEVGTSLADAFALLRQVQLAGLQQRFLESYARHLHELGQLGAERQLLGELPRLVIHLLTQAVVLLLVIYLHSSTANPALLVPVISLFALAGYRIVPGLQACLQAALQLYSSAPCLDLLWQDLAQLPPPSSSSRLAPLKLERGLRLEEVRFAYPRSTHRLGPLTVEIAAGSTVAFVGATGSGKTTLVHLLLGLLEPLEGAVLVDGERLTGERLLRWQRNLGYVSQDVAFTSGSLGENVSLGDPQAHREELERCLNQAALGEFVAALPAGIDTRVGERGIRLSGGQRQRLGIARALYRAPQVLVLDEATSALDGATEAQVMAELQQLKQGRTLVLVAHRLTTVANCDCIYVLKDGVIVSQGRYADLLERCQEFRRLARAAD